MYSGFQVYVAKLDICIYLGGAGMATSEFNELDYVHIVSQTSLHMCMCYCHPPRIHGGLAISRISA